MVLNNTKTRMSCRPGEFVVLKFIFSNILLPPLGSPAEKYLILQRRLVLYTGKTTDQKNKTKLSLLITNLRRSI